MWQHSPETTTRTTIAYCQKLVSRLDSEPNCVQLVPSDQVNQAGFLALFHMLECLLFGCAVSDPRVDVQRCMSDML
jgi:hypothetical protein